MHRLAKMNYAAALLWITISASSMPARSFAAVLSVTGRANVGLPSPPAKADWRPHPHGHHLWRVGWYYGSRRESHAQFTFVPKSEVYPVRSVAKYFRCFDCANYAATCPTCRPRACIRADGGLSWCDDCNSWDYTYGGPFWSSPGLF
jgi:hypothetical protein